MQFIETSIFTRQVTALLTDYEYSQLQGALSTHPDTGAIIPHSGGLRKIRWEWLGVENAVVYAQSIIGLLQMTRY